jgi:hypothetical protein
MSSLQAALVVKLTDGGRRFCRSASDSLFSIEPRKITFYLSLVVNVRQVDAQIFNSDNKQEKRLILFAFVVQISRFDGSSSCLVQC